MKSQWVRYSPSFGANCWAKHRLGDFRTLVDAVYVLFTEDGAWRRPYLQGLDNILSESRTVIVYMYIDIAPWSIVG